MSIKTAVATMTTAAILASSVVSCSYDDSELWGEINQIKQEVADLRTQVENELGALNELVNGLVTIADVKQQSDGSTLVTLSDGRKITIYPKNEQRVPTDVITTYEENGVLYWAKYDGLGNPQPILVNGKMVPVGDVAPQTKVNAETGAIEVSFDGGKTWITTGYSESVADGIFAGIDVVYSDWQVDGDGNPVALYAVITLNDGSVIKVGMQNGRLILPIDSVFVAYGDTVSIAVEVEDAADFMTQVPRGWTCEVKHSVKESRMTLSYTAPTYESVQNGYADLGGVSKLMVVFNNGSSAIASIKVSTNPSSVYFTEEGAYIEASFGTNYMLCGILPTSSFKPATLVSYCNSVLDGSATDGSNAKKYVREVAFMEEYTMFMTYEDLSNTKMNAGTEYTFWYVVPRTDAEQNMYVVENEIVACSYTHSVSSFEVTEASFFDVNIKFSAAGSLGYFLGYGFAADFDASEIAAYYTEYPDYLYFNKTEQSYEGSFLKLFDPYTQSLVPGTEYTAWYITKGTSMVVLEDNVRSWNFSTKPFFDGGDIEVTTSEEVIEYTRLSTTLSTNAGHVAIYYNIVPSYMATAYPDDTYRKEMLLTEGTRVITDKSVPVSYDKAKAGDKLTLFAMAVDSEGQFGKILVKEYTTKNFEYNDIDLKLNLTDYKVDDTKIEVTAEGAEKFVYVYAMVESEEWTEVYGGTKKKAGEFMIANPTDSRICDTSKANYALVDGKIQIAGLNMDEEYVIVVMAVAADGSYSQPQTVYFTPIANIGIVVKKTDANWAEGKPELILGSTQNIEFFNITWYIRPQKDYDAYTVALHPGNLVNEDLGTAIDTTEKLIAYIISMCDTGKTDQGHKCVYREDGNYSRTWETMEDLNGDGRFTSDEWVEHTEDGLPGVHNYCFYGTEDETMIFTTWVGPDGNFHEPFVYNPTEEKELVDWTLE